MGIKVVSARVGQEPQAVDVPADRDDAEQIDYEALMELVGGHVVEADWLLPAPYVVYHNQHAPKCEGWAGIHGDIVIARHPRMSFHYQSLSDGEVAAIIACLRASMHLQQVRDRTPEVEPVSEPHLACECGHHETGQALDHNHDQLHDMECPRCGRDMFPVRVRRRGQTHRLDTGSVIEWPPEIRPLSALSDPYED